MKKADPTTPATLQRWATLTKSLLRVGVEVLPMAGLPTLKLGGQAFGSLYGNSLVLKLDPASHPSTLALEGVELFDTGGTTHPMKGWIVLPFEHSKEWGALTASALTALATTAKARKRPPKVYPRRKH